jgi:hypothetical protein
MYIEIWKRGKVRVSLTDESAVSHYGFPVLRIQHPSGTLDCGPADFCSAPEGEEPGTAALLLATIHAHRPLQGEALAAGRRFLNQWVDCPYKL